MKNNYWMGQKVCSDFSSYRKTPNELYGQPNMYVWVYTHTHTHNIFLNCKVGFFFPDGHLEKWDVFIICRREEKPFLSSSALALKRRTRAFRPGGHLLSPLPRVWAPVPWTLPSQCVPASAEGELVFSLKSLFWDFPVSPVLKTPLFIAGGKSSIPGQGTKIPHAMGCGQNQKNPKTAPSFFS